MIKGLDVSSYQGTPDWKAVENTNTYGFVICKATEGDGVSQGGQDSSFASNWSALRNTNLQQGAYHFARPDLGNSPESEAEGFLNRINAVGGLLAGQGDLLALDMEASRAQGNLLDWTLRWLRHVENAVGFKPLFYSYPNFISSHGLEGNAELANYGLWIAGDTPTVPDPWQFQAIWQSTRTVTVPGISGGVDYNEFNGDAAGLHKYGIPDASSPVPTPTPAPVPVPAPTPTVKTYTVADGDSLWSIAVSEYGDGQLWQTIYNANIDLIGPNPNMIQSGQVLTIP